MYDPNVTPLFFVLSTGKGQLNFSRKGLEKKDGSSVIRRKRFLLEGIALRETTCRRALNAKTGLRLANEGRGRRK